MDFTLTTILVTLWSVFGLTAVAILTVLWRGRRSPAPLAAPAGVSAPVPLSDVDLEDVHRRWLDGLAETNTWDELTDSGRHHLPPDLLNLPTYQLGPDRLARAKVQDQDFTS
ncbi:hypothetical protein GCM10010435_16690 [Winogradskya consettensis]|uniref:Uncharacterized protein n=1 Tax=Winogradskya consettensis TaxID=113560 RepID=A0A919SUX3_9ACTN|nr:hypothetical protein [Actinoplanes consettensis]GIM78815.1 hypothetical protein Aco04nite_62360 [Actinoplanes consettensis]